MIYLSKRQNDFVISKGFYFHETSYVRSFTKISKFTVNQHMRFSFLSHIMQKPPINAHDDKSNVASGIIFGLSLYLHPYKCTLCMLAAKAPWSLYARQCDKYSKTCLKQPADQKLVFKTNYCLMQVKSIA